MNIRADDFNFNYIWEDPGGVTTPELAATWARVGMVCGGKVITSVHSPRLQSFRGDIYIPLYVMAEWFAKNWWFIQNECADSDRIASPEFQQRHNLAYSYEGLCLPDISFIQNGDEILVYWQEADYSAAGLAFQTSGNFLIDKDIFSNRVTQLIEDVINRLHQRGIHSSFLEEEWAHIRQIEKSAFEEKAFCEVSSRLGLDPFSIDEELSERIIACYEEIEPEIRDEFFFSSSNENFEPNIRWLNNARDKIKNECCVLFEIKSCPKAVNNPDQEKQPWLIGYKWAQEYRKILKNTDDFIDYKDFVSISNQSIAGLQFDETSLEAMISRKSGEHFSLVVNRENLDLENENSRFLFARILCEAIALSKKKAGILSKVETRLQKTSRAFAAEFLAPAQTIAKMVSGTVNRQKIQYLKEHFKVSDLVIRHQIVNHNLATIIEPEYLQY